jgi:hypothetical protein
MQGSSQKLFLARIKLVKGLLTDAKMRRDFIERDLAESPGKELIARVLQNSLPQLKIALHRVARSGKYYRGIYGF